MSEVSVTESGSHTGAGTRMQNFLGRAGLRGFPWKTATILYTISWGWLFIVRESLWADDWPRFIPEDSFGFRGAGLAPWLGYEKLIFHSIGLTGTRVLIFCLFFVSALFMFGLASKFNFINLSQTQFFILLFLLLPFNTSRIGLECFHYSVSYALFFAGWYSLIYFKGLKWFPFSLILFFLSFAMHSMLVFFVIAILHFFEVERRNILLLKAETCLKMLALMALPGIYWTLRTMFFPEQSLYHNLTIGRIRDSAGLSIFFLAIVFLLLFLGRNCISKKNAIITIAFGMLSAFLGLFAYIVMGYFHSDITFVPKYLVTFLGRSDRYSRHLTLQPLGIAMLIVGVTNLIFASNRLKEKFVRRFIVAICLIFNLGFGFEYVLDFVKQNAVVRELKLVGDNQSIQHIQVIDGAMELNARGRKYRPTDWSGLIWRAFGYDSRERNNIAIDCAAGEPFRLLEIIGPETHWEALKNWVSDGDMGFEVTVDDTPGACKPEMVKDEKVSGAIPILFYFTGAKG